MAVAASKAEGKTASRPTAKVGHIPTTRDDPGPSPRRMARMARVACAPACAARCARASASSRRRSARQTTGGELNRAWTIVRKVDPTRCKACRSRRLLDLRSLELIPVQTQNHNASIMGVSSNPSSLTLSRGHTQRPYTQNNKYCGSRQERPQPSDPAQMAAPPKKVGVVDPRRPRIVQWGEGCDPLCSPA